MERQTGRDVGKDEEKKTEDGGQTLSMWMQVNIQGRGGVTHSRGGYLLQSRWGERVRLREIFFFLNVEDQMQAKEGVKKKRRCFLCGGNVTKTLQKI